AGTATRRGWRAAAQAASGNDRRTRRVRRCSSTRPSALAQNYFASCERNNRTRFAGHPTWRGVGFVDAADTDGTPERFKVIVFLLSDGQVAEVCFEDQLKT